VGYKSVKTQEKSLKIMIKGKPRITHYIYKIILEKTIKFKVVKMAIKMVQIMLIIFKIIKKNKKNLKKINKIFKKNLIL
jgi:hypothetical protein